MATPSVAASGVPVGQSPSLYVGDLDKDVTEAQLFSTFSPFGTVTSMRICRDAITRKSLGYAYVNFSSVADAATAMRELNYTKLRDRPLRIMWVQRDPSLRRSASGNVFVKNLDASVDSRTLSETFNMFGPVVSCRVVTDAETGKSKGYGFVQFDSDEAAKKAIDEANGANINGKPIYVGPFKRRDARSAATEFTNLYVRGLPPSWTEDQVRTLFSPHGTITSALVVRDASSGKSKGVAFVNFSKPAEAEAALKALNDTPLEEEDERVFGPKAAKKADEGEKEEGETLSVEAAAEKPAADGESASSSSAAAPSEEKKEEAAADASASSSSAEAAKPVETTDAAASTDSTTTASSDAKASESAAAAAAADGGKKAEEAAASDAASDSKPKEEGADDASAALSSAGAAAAAADAAEKKADDSSASASTDAASSSSSASAEKKEEDGEKKEEEEGGDKAAEQPQQQQLYRLYVARFQPKSERARDMAAKFREARGRGGADGEGGKGGNSNLYVKNLDESVGDEELRSKFVPYGPITSAKVMKDPKSGVSKGFGFVSFASPEDAQRALGDANKSLWRGRPLYVSLAQPKAVRMEQLTRLRAQAAMRAQQQAAGSSGGGYLGRAGAMGGPGAGGMMTSGGPGSVSGGMSGSGGAGAGGDVRGLMYAPVPGATLGGMPLTSVAAAQQQQQAQQMMGLGYMQPAAAAQQPAAAAAAAAQLAAYQQQYTVQVLQAVQSGAINMAQAQALLAQMAQLMGGAAPAAPATARSVSGGQARSVAGSVAAPSAPASVSGGAPRSVTGPASVTSAAAAPRPVMVGGPGAPVGAPGSTAAAAGGVSVATRPAGAAPGAFGPAAVQPQQAAMAGGPRPLPGGVGAGQPSQPMGMRTGVPQQQQQQQQAGAGGPRPMLYASAASLGGQPQQAQAAMAQQRPMVAAQQPAAAQAQRPQASAAAAAAAVPVGSPAFMELLQRSTPEQQRNLLGERLYPRVQELDKGAGRVGKLTGMLLELPSEQVLELLMSPPALAAKVEEAMAVLQEHNAATQRR